MSVLPKLFLNFAMMSRRLILLLTGAMLVLSSCDGSLFGSPEISASPEACLFQAEDSDVELMVLCDGKWTASLAHGSWVSVSASSGKGNGTIRLDYDFNSGWDSRTDSLVLKCGRNTTYVPLRQQGLESLFSVKELNIRGMDAQEFTASLPSDWKVSAGASWLKVSPAEGVASSNIRFNVYPVGECLDSESRSASLDFSIGGRPVSLKVIQGKTEKVSLDSGIRTVGCDGGVLEVQVGSNVAYSVDIDASCSGWVELAGTKAYTSSVVTLRVLPNDSRDERSGTVVIGSGQTRETLAIIQEGRDPVVGKDEFGYYEDARAVVAYDRYAFQYAVTSSAQDRQFRLFRVKDGRTLVVDGLREGMETGMYVRLSVVQDFDANLPYRTVKSYRVARCTGTRVWLSADDGSGLIVPKI